MGTIVTEGRGGVGEILKGGGAQPRLNSLTGLRFYAALAIVLRHVLPPILTVPLLSEIVAVGPIGVGFFFVLSGFVLAWGYQDGVSYSDFYLRRFARIYPLHFVTTVTAVIVAILTGAALYPASTALSLTLMQSWFGEAWRHGGNTVSWSLSCEAFFYACFPLIISRFRRLGVKTGVIVMFGIFIIMGVYVLAYALMSVWSGMDLNGLSPYSNPAYRIGEFLIGILLARQLQQGVRSRFSLNVAVLLTVIAVAGLAVINSIVAHSGLSLGGEGGLPLFVLDLMFLPVAAFLILAAASCDLGGQRSMFAGTAHVALGQWSFALYLVHPIVLAIVLYAMPETAGPLYRSVLFGLAVVSAVAFSAFVFRTVEVPLERRIRQWSRLRRAKIVL